MTGGGEIIPEIKFWTWQLWYCDCYLVCGGQLTGVKSPWSDVCDQADAAAAAAAADDDDDDLMSGCGSIDCDVALHRM